MAKEALTKIDSHMDNDIIIHSEFRDSIKGLYGLLWASIGGIGLLLIGEVIQLVSHGKGVL